MEIIIKEKGIGINGFWDVRNQLHEFVKENFDVLYEGAVRLGCNIGEDYYAPRRVQINRTRLHHRDQESLKYADGHKYNDDVAPTEAQLRQTVDDIQTLLDAAAENIPAPFILTIKAAVHGGKDGVK